MRNKFLLFKPPRLWYFLPQPQKTNTEVILGKRSEVQEQMRECGKSNAQSQFQHLFLVLYGLRSPCHYMFIHSTSIYWNIRTRHGAWPYGYKRIKRQSLPSWWELRYRIWPIILEAPSSKHFKIVMCPFHLTSQESLVPRTHTHPQPDGVVPFPEFSGIPHIQIFFSITFFL